MTIPEDVAEPFEMTQFSLRMSRAANGVLGMAARLVRGCDLWLNLPRPPLEASGGPAG